MSHLKYLILAAFLAIGVSAAEWTAVDGENKDLPGRKIEIKLDGQLVARFIYGEGQIKPYLTVLGEEGDELTKWDEKQKFPHHRGIYIGWNKIASELGSVDKAGKVNPKGTYDLWHFNNGGKMEVAKLEKVEGGKENATIVANIVWRAGHKDAAGSDVLLNEMRTLVISRPAPKKTQVDAKFVLTAAREITLGGDLQHAGIHFRGSAELLNRQGETAYVWEPAVPNASGKALSREFKYARLIFPIGTRWYTSTHLNSPENPVEELSMREYGRFGFFFTKSLKKDEVLPVQYRIVTAAAEKVAATKSKLGAEDDAKHRKEAQAEYDEFVKSARK